MRDGAGSISCSSQALTHEERIRINSLLSLSCVFDEIKDTCYRRCSAHNDDRIVSEFIYSIPEVACVLRDAEIKEKLSKSIVALSVLDRQQCPKHRESFAEFMAEVIMYGLMTVPDKALSIFHAQGCSLVSFLTPYLLNCKVYTAIDELLMTPKTPSLCVILAQRLTEDFRHQVFDSTEWNQNTADYAELWCGLLRSLIKYIPMENSIEVLEHFARCMDSIIPLIVRASSYDGRSYVFLPLVIDIISVFGTKTSRQAMYDKMPSLFPSLCRATQQYTKILEASRNRATPNMLSPLPPPFSPIKILTSSCSLKSSSSSSGLRTSSSGLKGSSSGSKTSSSSSSSATSISPRDYQAVNITQHDNVTTLLIIQLFCSCVKNCNAMAANLSCNLFLSEAIECMRAKPNNSVLHGEVVNMVRAIVDRKSEVYSEMISECQIPKMITILISEWDKDANTRHRILHCAEIARMIHAAYPHLDLLEQKHQWMLSPSLSSLQPPIADQSDEDEHHPLKCSPPLRRNFADPSPSSSKFCAVQFSHPHFLSLNKPSCLEETNKSSTLRRMASRTKRLLHRDDKKDSRVMICNQ
eukprot:TRINITY_DN912_c0_g1_i1.p1 TRINITY_DN912_c0_g1~~TRINITY_DN912_c0_g1_i1.p1  ORF type:complete len:582 (+),score=128.29 TRINITY_DN912_c0_g1_i1:113-1858(+)